MANVNEQTPPEGTPSEPVPGTPEYAAAMGEKYRSAQAPEDQSSEQPDPADSEEPPTEEEGGETEKPSLTIQPGDESEEETSEGETEENTKEGGEQEEETQEAPSGIAPELFETASTEFAETGELTDETIEGFVKAGIPREFVDTYVEGARAVQAQMISEAQGLVGGEDNWNAMMGWAKSLPEADIEAFNTAVTDPKTSALAIQGLYARYAAEAGSENPSVASDAERGAISGDVYSSKAEMTADMRDPKYKTDPAFRDQVAQKIARSRSAGTLGPMGTAY